MTSELITAIREHQSAFGVDLSRDALARLEQFYAIIQTNNPPLHLVAPCSAEEFAVRHVLESLTLIEDLPQNARFADVGTGAGLPAIPCLLVREDLSAVLIESKVKKANYLEGALGELGISGRATVVNRQFEEVESERFAAVTCRALDKFTEKLPRLLKWSRGSRRLFFGGPSLGEALAAQSAKFENRLMPMSEQRFLFVVEP